MSAPTTTAPVVSKVFQRKGTCGQFSVQATVTHPGEEPRVVEFVGSSYGGPVLMITETWETYVSEPGRFGRFGKGWVRRFFA